MRTVLDRLACLHKPDAFVWWSKGTRAALLHAVFNAEIDRIHATSLRKFVEYRLHRKSHVGSTRRSIRRSLGLVHHHIVTVNQEIRHFVAANRGHSVGAPP